MVLINKLVWINWWIARFEIISSGLGRVDRNQGIGAEGEGGRDQLMVAVSGYYFIWWGSKSMGEKPTHLWTGEGCHQGLLLYTGQCGGCWHSLGTWVSVDNRRGCRRNKAWAGTTNATYWFWLEGRAEVFSFETMRTTAKTWLLTIRASLKKNATYPTLTITCYKHQLQ